MNTMSLQAALDLPVNELADAYPMLDGEELVDLAQSVSLNGIREPLIVFNGELLDGRNRRLAAEKALLTEVPYTVFEGTIEQAEDLIIDLNEKRRHLTSGQRAIVANRHRAIVAVRAEARRLATLPQSGQQGFQSVQSDVTPSLGGHGETEKLLAERHNVAHSYINAVAQLERATAETIDTEDGALPTPRARAAEKALAQVWAGKSTMNAALTEFKAVTGGGATAGNKTKPEPKPETGIVTGADTSWAPEAGLTYEQKRANYVEALVRTAEHMASQIARFALTDGDIADAAEPLSDDAAEILAAFFGSLR